MDILKGRLTYLLALLAVSYGVIGFFAGWVDTETASTIVWGGLATFGLRRAVGK